MASQEIQFDFLASFLAAITFHSVSHNVVVSKDIYGFLFLMEPRGLSISDQRSHI